jgi:hypothetical protein
MVGKSHPTRLITDLRLTKHTHIYEGNDMSEVAMLQGAGPKQILQTAIEKKIPAIMTYLSKGKWHVAKVLLTALGHDTLSIEGTYLPNMRHPINIRACQPVGISFKYGYGKFVFDTTVVGLEPSPDPATGGTIVLSLPNQIEVIQRRSYYRVEVPESLKVNVLLWYRNGNEAESTERETRYEIHDYFQGKLVDISAGGAQVVIPHQSEADNMALPRDEAAQESIGEGRPVKKGQFISVRFTPMPYEMPLMFNAQIRNVLPAEDDKSIYVGLQIVGLEASSEGRKVLSRLVGVVERYFKINQSGAKQQDMQKTQSVS